MLRHVKNHVNKLKQPARHVWNWKLMKRNFRAIFLIHLPGTEWSSRRPSMPHFHPALPRSSRSRVTASILCSLLRHKSYLTLPYVTSLRDSFCLGTFAHGFSRLLPLSLTSLRGCSLAIIRFTIVIIILPVCNASQLTYQYATSIDSKAFSDLA